MTPKRITFLVNPSSGTRSYQKAVETIYRTFLPPLWAPSVHVLAGAGEALVRARQAANAGHWAVVVVGGDGTLNEVLSVLVGKTTRLGLIPHGTGNGFARGAGIPLDPGAACLAIAEGRQKKMDA